MIVPRTLKSAWNALLKAASDGTFPCWVTGVRGGWGGCRYRMGGKRCAAGIFISDKKYQESFETAGDIEAAREFADRGAASQAQLALLGSLRLPKSMTIDDMAQIQQAHDILYPAWNGDRFIEALRAVPCFAEMK